jgi:hypothetical protein
MATLRRGVFCGLAILQSGYCLATTQRRSDINAPYSTELVV